MLTVVIVAPAAVVGVATSSVLQLFLIADLLAAALLVPGLLGLWRRTTSTAVWGGIVAGVAGAVTFAAVNALSCRAKGKATTVAPCSGQLTRGESAISSQLA